MNEVIRNGSEIGSHITDTGKVIDTILNNFQKTRQKTGVSFRPFKRINGVSFEKLLLWQNVDFGKTFPSAKEGDSAYVEFDIFCSDDEKIFLNTSFNTDVEYNGEKVYSAVCEYDDLSDMAHIPIEVRKEENNRVKIYCTKHNGQFAFRFLLSVQRYPFMWANDYLFYARAVLPGTKLCYEEGMFVSDLISEGKPSAPVLEVENREGKGINYIFTECKKSGMLETEWLKRVFVNRKEIFEKETAVNQGDVIIAVCEDLKAACEFFTGERYHLSFLNSARKEELPFMYLGPFDAEIEHAELLWQTPEKIYRKKSGEKTYWRFADGSELRIYLDSVFYGQWFYALMVGFYGIREASDICKRKDLSDLFCENMRFMAKHYDYIKYETEKYKMPTFMPRVGNMTVLDNIGTMGMNFTDACLKTGEDLFLKVIDEIRYNAENTVPRFPDGTYYRVDTMWADDLYMSCPFLVRMGRLTGDDTWYKKAVKQVMGFKERLYMEDKHLFSHIFFVKENSPNRIAWGRGNGWVMWTLSEILLYVKDFDVTFIRNLFFEMAQALKEYQSESGFWRQVIDSDDERSYPETSCTGMFMLAFIRGVKLKILDNSFIPCIKKAWEGLKTKSIDAEGNVYGVCMGSECSMKKEYYYKIPTIINDDHGTGVILTAAAEYMELFD